jgi:hypothetical protein
MLITALLLGVGLGSSAFAQLPDPGDVYCGSVTVFRFRVPAEGKLPDARANAAMDVLNKYLGGKYGKVTTKPAGQNVKLLLNNEVVAVLTPADAQAEKEKTLKALATKWSRVLAKAFDATKAVR